MSTQPGPRDWLPSSCAARSQRPLTVPQAVPNHALRAAGLSTCFGSVALLMAASPLIPGEASFRWMISTVGMSAVLWGIRAARQRDGRARMASSVLTALGVATGAFATLVMVGLLLAVHGPTGAGA